MTFFDKFGLCYLLIINLLAFFLFGIDKWKANHGRWRIRERTLLLSAALGGGLGALVGMKVWHHKTRKAKFAILVPVCLVAWAVAVVYFRFYF